MKLFSSPEPAPRPKLTDEEEWQKWRDFIGSKRTCDDCGLVMGDPGKHAAWHEDAGPRRGLGRRRER